jgi:hypothetical protein
MVSGTISWNFDDVWVRHKTKLLVPDIIDVQQSSYPLGRSLCGHQRIATLIIINPFKFLTTGSAFISFSPNTKGKNALVHT